MCRTIKPFIIVNRRKQTWIPDIWIWKNSQCEIESHNKIFQTEYVTKIFVKKQKAKRNKTKNNKQIKKKIGKRNKKNDGKRTFLSYCSFLYLPPLVIFAFPLYFSHNSGPEKYFETTLRDLYLKKKNILKNIFEKNKKKHKKRIAWSISHCVVQ